jgi:hypothetical protein
VPAGDSFVVILAAASQKPFSVQPVAGFSAKGQGGQSLPNRGATKQAPLVQGKESSRASAVLAPDDRVESGMNETTDDQENANSTKGCSSSIASGSSWSATANDARLQTPTASTVVLAMISTLQTAAPIAWSGSTFKTPIAGSSRPQANGDRPLRSCNQTQNDKPVLSGKACGQAIDQLSAFIADGIPNNTAAKEKAANVPACGLGLGVQASEASAADSKITAPQQISSSQDQQASAALQDTTAHDGSAAPAAFPGKEGGMESACNTTQKADPYALRSKNPNVVYAANAGDAPAQSSQSAQAGPSQSSAAATRVVEITSSHPQLQTAVNLAVANEAPVATRQANSSGETSYASATRQAAAALDSDSNHAMATSAISTARLMQTTAESEMRIGLNSSGFGDISIRASISNHQLVAQISLDHSELSQAISAHASSIQEKLGNEYGLSASIEINNLASPHSGEAGGSSPRESSSQAGSIPAASAMAPVDEGSSLSQETIVNSSNGPRLDIRA